MSETQRYVPVCEPCIAGEGSECHTPECALFLRDVPADGLIAEFAVTAADLRAARPVVDVLAGQTLEAFATDVRRAVAEEIAAEILKAAENEERPHRPYIRGAARIAREVGESP